jgi:long-subunit fatty acid transport protein
LEELDKMFLKRNIAAMLVLLLFAGITHAVTFSKVGMAGAQFLKIAAGARAVGMAEAFSAVVDDATAMYWNPAGLAKMKRQEVSFTHNNWLADTKHEFISYCLPMGPAGNLGFDITVLNIGEMEITTTENPDGTGEYFNCYDWQFSAGYARNLTDKVAFGVSGKYIQQTIWDVKASAVAMDLGIIAETGLKSLRIAASMINFGSDIRFSGGHLINDITYNNLPATETSIAKMELLAHSAPLPLSYRVGLAYDLMDNSKHKLTTAMDYVHPNDGSEKQNFGAEYSFNRLLFVRSGVRVDIDARDDNNGYSPTFGIGVNYGFGMVTTKIDYAYADYGSLENAHRIALSLMF